MNRFDKQKLVLRMQLQGAGYHDALAVMEFCEAHHRGTRKDGVTPEFAHQISIALYAMTLPDLVDREGVIATIFGHDTSEDAHVHWDEVGSVMLNRQRASDVSASIDTMTKTFRGIKRDEVELFERMANDVRSSIAKGCDRINNFQSMPGVFTVAKQRQYIDEGRRLFLPMLKKARRNFPHQVNAYENIKFVLTSQIELLEVSLDALEAAA